MNRWRSLVATALVVAAGLPADGATAQAPATDPAGEGQRIRDLAPRRVLDLQFRTSDLEGTNRTTEREDVTEIALATDVLFGFDEAALTAAAGRVLSGVAEQIAAQASGAVSIRGHTDAKGSDAYNLRLSRRRAEAVERALRDELDRADLTFAVEGLGETAPVAPNQKDDGSDDPEGRAQNRRVEIEFSTGGQGPGQGPSETPS